MTPEILNNLFIPAALTALTVILARVTANNKDKLEEDKGVAKTIDYKEGQMSSLNEDIGELRFRISCLEGQLEELKRELNDN